MARTRHPLTVLKVIAPHRYSGAERIAVCLADQLGQRGHRVVFACNGQDEFVTELATRDIECISEGIYGKANPLPLYRLLTLAREVDADIIHTHLSSGAWLGSVAGRMLRIPVLAHVHALNTKTCFVHADMLAACSRGVKEHMVGQGIPAERVRVIYNGINLQTLERLRPLEDVRTDMAISDGQPIIGVAAHLTAKKGQRYVVEATALLKDRHPNLLCYLLGEGEQRAELEQLARDLGVADRVRLLGFRTDAVDLMQAMDIVVLPSVAKEGLGLCLLEASALRKPVIGSDAPGIDEAIDRDRTGLLVAPRQADALADAIDGLIRDRELRDRMGIAGRERVERLFSLNQMVESTEKLYYEMIDAKKRRVRRPQ